MKQWHQKRQGRRVKYSPSSEIKVIVGKASTHSGRCKSTEREKAAEMPKCSGQRGRRSPKQAKISESGKEKLKSQRMERV